MPGLTAVESWQQAGILKLIAMAAKRYSPYSL